MFPINAISVDPSFFEQIDTLEELDTFKSDRESMCYLLIYLDRKGGYCYCVSQGQKISINEKDIKTSEIDSALQFVTTTEKSRDGVICSDCLYKYLRTLGEASEGFLTDSERQEIIASYVKEVSSRLAAEICGISESTGTEQYERHLKRYINKLNKSRSQWAALSMKIKEEGADEILSRLVEYYRALYRLEAIFLTQTLALNEPSDQSDPLQTLQFMVGISEKVIKLSDQIRETTQEIIKKQSMSHDIQETLKKHAERRQKTEFKFINVVKILSEIDSHTS
ncbi:hypothetical protein EU527_19675 [Candidatus Thorarchaeota archaeon]|nr:MAG: hypothetical protein EU527_19675 [Candidatus Thorarchaeota archaeon]